MKYFIKLFFIIVFSFSFLIANQKDSDNIASLSASALFNLDNNTLKKTIDTYIKSNEKLKALIIIDSLTGNTLIEVHKRNEDVIYKKVPQNMISELDKFESIANYENEEVGKIIAYFEKDNTQISVNLTDEEQSWIRDNPTVKIIEFFDEEPFTINTDKKTGYIYELLEYLIKSVGLKIEYQKGFKSYGDMLHQVEKKNTDILTTYPTELNLGDESNIIASKSILKTPFVIVGKSNSKIKRIEDLYGKKVAVVKGYAQDKYLSAFPKIEKFHISNNKEGFDAIRSNKADYYLNNRANSEYIINKSFETDLSILFELPYDSFPPLSISFAMNKENEALVKILQKALEQISFKKIQTIKGKWLNLEDHSLKLSQKEKEWLDKKQAINYVYDPDWAPFEWKNDINEHTGIIYDILSLIEKKSGIKFNQIETDTWKETVNLIRTNKADMYSGVGENSERKKYVKFTKNNLFKTPYVLLTHKDDKNFYLDTFTAIKSKNTAVIDGYTIDGILKDVDPNLVLTKVKTVKKALELLRDKKIDIFIVNAATAKHAINKQGYDDLKIATRTEFNLELKVALLKEFPDEALSIIDKALDEITEKEIADIYYKWTEIQVKKAVDWSLLYKIVTSILLILLIVLFWNRRLKKAVNDKTSELQALTESLEVKVKERTLQLEEQEKKFRSLSENSPDTIMRFDKEYRHLYVNPVVEKLTGIPAEAFINKTHEEIGFPPEQCKFFDDIIEEVFQTKNKYRIEFQLPNDSWVDWLLIPEIDKNNEVVAVMTTARDVSEKKVYELEIKTAKQALEELHNNVKDSIQYASLIQSSLVPSQDLFKKYFDDYLAIWEPKDIVGGDIYLLDELRSDNECLLMVIDCTGHGVPGAFVTMLVKAIERQVAAIIASEPSKEVSPAWILKYFNQTMKELLKQESDDSISNAGFDGGILYFNKQKNIIKFAGAEISLYFKDIENNEYEIIKGDRHSIGYKKSDINYEFKDHIIESKKGMLFYMTTDGYIDQNGGEKGFPLGKRKFKSLLEDNHTKSFNDQKEIFMQNLIRYQGSEERNDDITIVGIKI